MLKKENLRKNFLRVKQIADQNFGRAEKSEVLSEDLQTVERRVDLVRQVCQTTSKKVALCLQGSGPDLERRHKKIPENVVGLSMIENANLLGVESIMGQMFEICGECHSHLARDVLQFELDVEKQVLIPIQEILDNEIPVISKCKKQLTKLTLDMDSARSRWNQAVKQTQVHGANMSTSSTKADQIKEEYEEACNRMHQARDTLATEMFNFVAKEAEHSQKLLELVKIQRDYHKRALETLDRVLPKMSEALECNPLKPVYGVLLEEHLRVTGRDIALVLEACVVTLIEGGLEEEGLFRIAGMASKVKKLKNAFDANVIDMEEYGLDLHSVAGALKQYLRELPEPLLTTQLYEEFLQDAQAPQDQRLQCLWTTLHKLPKANYDNFRYLIKFLAKLADRSSENKMTPSNISIVIGPNLLWSEEDNGPNMITSGTISSIVEQIIIHADWFYPEEIEFGTLASLTPNKNIGSDMQDTGGFEQQSDSEVLNASSNGQQAESPRANRVNQPPSPTSASPPYNAGPPLAESEDIMPKAQKRIPRKPAPPPPPDRPHHLPDRPYSIAVTASMSKPNQLSSMTWPRQQVSPNQDLLADQGGDNSKQKLDKPLLPERPAGNIQRASTMVDRHSHPDRPTVPPPERPKVPPPAVPNHQRSASAGSPSNFITPITPAPSTQSKADNDQGMNKTGTL